MTRAHRCVLPYFTRGRVVSGCGRGGKQLGCPTANLEETTVQSLPLHFDCGVYYGYASVDDSPFYAMVMSIGWNPQFQNKRKSMEVHLLHEFSEDFYGAMLRVAVTGFIREMRSFESLDDLMKAINMDITFAREELEKDDPIKYAEADYSFQTVSHSVINNCNLSNTTP